MSGTLQQAIAAIKAGDKVGGQRLLAEVIRNDPRNEAAWLWLSAALDSDEQRRTCLERVLAINPGNVTAQQGLARLGSTLQSPALSSPGTPSPGAARPASSPPSLTGQVRRARPALTGWSLLIAFDVTVVMYATIGIATYLALTGLLDGLRQLARLASRCKENAV